jgi:polyhydroxyalkanoate synthesis repressor PhaR
MRLIKKYSNRKLYDTEKKSYVVLEEIWNDVWEGEDVRVVDQVTGRDITATVLAQAIARREERRPTLSVTRLAALIRECSVESVVAG